MPTRPNPPPYDRGSVAGGPGDDLRGPGLHHDRADVVRHDVVQLPGEARAFVLPGRRDGRGDRPGPYGVAAPS